MVVDVTDVRKMLGEITESMLTTPTIQQCISLAAAFVTFNQASGTSLHASNNAILMLARALAYSNYIETVHRQQGDFPTASRPQLIAYYREADEFLRIAGIDGFAIRRHQRRLPPQLALPDSFKNYYEWE